MSMLLPSSMPTGLLACFQDDPILWLGVQNISDDDVRKHITTHTRCVTLSHDHAHNTRAYLWARYHGDVLCNSDGTLHPDAPFLARLYLKQQAYARGGLGYENAGSAGERLERSIQRCLIAMSSDAKIDVSIPGPYADTNLKTDLILELRVSGKMRKIAVQITSNTERKEEKFREIQHAYSTKNKARLPYDFQVDDVCLLFVKSSELRGVEILCMDFITYVYLFQAQGEKDQRYHIPHGEIVFSRMRNPVTSMESSVVGGLQDHVSDAMETILAVPVAQVHEFLLPFTLEDVRILQSELTRVLKSPEFPGKRGERILLSLFDDEKEGSYFPGFIQNIKQWSKKLWMLGPKGDIPPRTGRISLEHYNLVRKLLSENTKDRPKKEQKLQQVLEIMEAWFPGLYECVDCVICLGGNPEQKERLKSYQKTRAIVDVSTILTDQSVPREDDGKKQRREHALRVRSQKREADKAEYEKRHLLEQKKLRQDVDDMAHAFEKKIITQTQEGRVRLPVIIESLQKHRNRTIKLIYSADAILSHQDVAKIKKHLDNFYKALLSTEYLHKKKLESSINGVSGLVDALVKVIGHITKRKM